MPVGRISSQVSAPRRGSRALSLSAPVANSLSAPPSLHSGDRLSQPEFHRRYLHAPPHLKAELIQGVVYVASPVHQPHGTVGGQIATLLGLYSASTPGVQAVDNATIIFNAEQELQPDHCLRIRPEFGGRPNPDPTGPITQPPELVVEVAHSSVSLDLHAKRDAYRAGGVREYVVLTIEEQQLFAFDLSRDRPHRADRAGVWRSRAFPGLWIASAAIFGDDLAAALAVLQTGLARPEHARWAARLARQAQRIARPPVASTRTTAQRSRPRP